MIRMHTMHTDAHTQLSSKLSLERLHYFMFREDFQDNDHELLFRTELDCFTNIGLSQVIMQRTVVYTCSYPILLKVRVLIVSLHSWRTDAPLLRMPLFVVRVHLISWLLAWMMQKFCS